ncbi:methylated-DNA--protein-cysteine methyltransferase [Companilactobacillus sp. RD055328]|uniref:methylated-DNA--[protein]-cysteine S-methyltransferase n=1 Tax=Companilactobacillus sp. RD055328 TaxID=2916634 RepID=UPI001FC8E242|nr:methylated-DNA--[protein]-cysteine S-methyltransferase [Companilactobacillus sp. RD055328]GKQ42194.1 methylated-DNA--protein-cysteine methyltransferase [Companilactobacillus sp. RD055328]
MAIVYYDDFIYQNQSFIYAYTDIGICFIGSPNSDINEMNDFIKPEKIIKKANNTIKEELISYLSGKLIEFNQAIDLSWSTAFQKSVYSALSQVKYSELTDYSSLASTINQPTATRAVATAVAKNPVLFMIPCHRVIRKNGSLGGYRAGLPLKQYLLNLEKK